MFTHSSAALSMAGRLGAGKIMHLDTRLLWVQQKQCRGEIEFRKVFGSDNVEELWAKNVDHIGRIKHMQQIGFRYEGGRADKAVGINMVRSRI